jgi:hypothetical protein
VAVTLLNCVVALAVVAVEPMPVATYPAQFELTSVVARTAALPFTRAFAPAEANAAAASTAASAAAPASARSGGLIESALTSEAN